MFTHELFNADAAGENLEQIKELVNTGDINLSDYRQLYEKKTGKKTALTNDELTFMVAGVGDDQDEDTWVAIMDSRGGEVGDEEDITAEEKEVERSQETIAIDRNTAVAMERSAKAFAKHLDTGFIDTMFDIQKADEKTKRGIAIMLCDRLYGDKAWDNEVWGNIPDPRITPKQVKEMQGRTNVLLPRWTYKDGNRNRVGDWFETAISFTKEGSALRKIIDDIEAAGGDEKKTEDQQQYVSLGDDGRQRKLRQMTNRMSNIVNRWKRMVRLKLIIDEINELHPTVHAGLIREVDKEGNETATLTDTLDCLAVEHLNSKGKVIKVDSFQPNTFLRLNPAEVKPELVEKKGNYWEALLSTKDRVPNPGGTDFKVPTSPEKFIGAMNSLSHYFEEGSNFEAFQKQFAKLESDAERKEVAETLEEAAQKIGQYYTFVKPTLAKIREQEKAATTTNGKDKGTASPAKIGGVKAA